MAEAVGSRAESRGYCLPIGYTAAAAEAITPNNGEEASLALLNLGQ